MCYAIVLGGWVSNQSFWIDECNSAIKAIQPTFSSFCSTLFSQGGSDSQMPLYMFILWIWEKIFGSGEFWLRSLNILFSSLALLIIAKENYLSTRFRIIYGLLITTSPMLCIYMDEARPYVLQFLASIMIFIPMMCYKHNEFMETFNFRMFLLGVIVLCGSSLTGVLFSFWACLWLLLSLLKTKNIKQFILSHKFLIAFCVVTLCLLGIYYLLTLFNGSRASSISKTTLSTLGFCAYEFLGFMGVGPSRISLRESYEAALSQYIGEISIFAIIVFVPYLLFFIVKRNTTFDKEFKKELMSSFVFILGALSMVFVGATMNMRVLARHLMPLLPVYLFFLSYCFDKTIRYYINSNATMRKSTKSVVLCLFILFSVTMLFSCLSFRFQEIHKKDDYKGVVTYLKNNAPQKYDVWWAADGAASEVYDVASFFEKFVVITNSNLNECIQSKMPQVVVLSKPDIYDNKGILLLFLKDNNFKENHQFTSFVIYENTNYSRCN